MAGQVVKTLSKRFLALLERAFEAEIAGALNGGPSLLQTKSASVTRLVKEGYLIERTEVLSGRFPVTIEGYELTHLGRLTYCLTCEDPS